MSAEAFSYVTRQADADLFDGLLAGDYCYVLNSRQMGKSSLCVRTINRLQELGVQTAFVDLSKFGGSNLKAEQWYASLLSEIGRALNLRREFLDYWKENLEVGPLHRLFGALHEVALRHVEGQLILFIDEIDTVRSLPFSTDEFFAAIRQSYVGRATNPDLHRLVFCILGTATPADLIQDTRVSPFNVGKRIEVCDFTLEEALPLASGLGLGGKSLLTRVLYWTGGHPYLTQRLCRAITETPYPNVDALCKELFLTHTARESDDNLTFVRNRLFRSEVDHNSLLDLYKKVIHGKRVANDETDPLTNVLKLSGVVSDDAGLLKVRNRIYSYVFNEAWIAQHTEAAEQRRQKAAYRQGIQRALIYSGGVLAVIVILAAFGFSQAILARRNAQRAYDSAQAERVARAQADKNALLYREQAELATQNAAERQKALQEANEQRTVALSAKREAEAKAREASVATALAVKARMGETSAKQEAEAKAALARANAARASTIARMANSERDKAQHNAYISNMAQVQREWETNNVAHVTDMLDETKQSSSLGFEWGYWNRLRHLELITLQGHTGAITSVACSPDGKRLLTGSKDHTARVWDIATGHALFTLNGHTDSVNTVAFSADGEHLLTGSMDKSVKVWGCCNRQRDTDTSWPHQ